MQSTSSLHDTVYLLHEPRPSAGLLASPTLSRSTTGLVGLYIAQACERFAFFALLPLFLLHLHRGYGLTEKAALLLFSIFQGLSYVGGLPAGTVTDRKLQPMTGALLGTALLTLGYAALATQRSLLWWPALALMTIGHSFFKPNITVLIGSHSPGSSRRRDRAFLWQHVAINLGALIGSLCAEWYRSRGLWNTAVVMLVSVSGFGTLVLAFGSRCLGPARSSCLRPVDLRPRRAEPERVRAVWLLCAVSVVFWITAHQAMSTLLLFAGSRTDPYLSIVGHPLRVAAGHFIALHALLVLGLMVPFMNGLTWLRRHRIEPSTTTKMMLGYFVTAAAFALLTVAGLCGGDTGRISPGWLGGGLLLLSIGELLLSPLGLSLLTQIAPGQQRSQTVGLWFVAAAAGHGFAAVLSWLWEGWPHHRYFASLALMALGAAYALLSRLRWLDGLLDTSCRTGPRGTQ